MSECVEAVSRTTLLAEYKARGREIALARALANVSIKCDCDEAIALARRARCLELREVNLLIPILSTSEHRLALFTAEELAAARQRVREIRDRAERAIDAARGIRDQRLAEAAQRAGEELAKLQAEFNAKLEATMVS